MADDRKGAAAVPETVRVVTVSTLYRDPRKVTLLDDKGREYTQTRMPRAIPPGTTIEFPVEEAGALLAGRHVRLPTEPPPPAAIVTGADATSRAPMPRTETVL
jgi:hypothetical protein